MVALASAAPHLRKLQAHYDEPPCHPAVASPIVAGYCEHIEELTFFDKLCHSWEGVRAADITRAISVGNCCCRAEQRLQAIQSTAQLRAMV